MSFREVVADPEAQRVHEVLVLAGQISQRDDSHYSASLRGGPQFLGWTMDRYIAAHTDDTLHVILGSLGGKRATADDMWPRPAVQEVIKPPTIADFDTGFFMRMISN